MGLLTASVKKMTNMTNGTRPNVPLYSPALNNFSCLKAQRKPDNGGLIKGKEASLSSSLCEVAYGFDRSIYLNLKLKRCETNCW